MEVIAFASCVLALFYYWEWRRTRDDLDALHEAVRKLGDGDAVIVKVDQQTYRIEETR